MDTQHLKRKKKIIHYKELLALAINVDAFADFLPKKKSAIL